MHKIQYFTWGLGIAPNPQSPIPNPQSPLPQLYFLFYIKNNKFKNLNNIFSFFYTLYKFNIYLIIPILLYYFRLDNLSISF